MGCGKDLGQRGRGALIPFGNQRTLINSLGDDKFLHYACSLKAGMRYFTRTLCSPQELDQVSGLLNSVPCSSGEASHINPLQNCNKLLMKISFLLWQLLRENISRTFLLSWLPFWFPANTACLYYFLSGMYLFSHVLPQ